MTLDDYLRVEHGRLTKMARTLGISISALHGYAKGRRQAGVSVAMAIERETGGEVTAEEIVAALDKHKSSRVSKSPTTRNPDGKFSRN
jgi:DNA-binding transcriptional regulator YdaS (Cro superfamily)